jgi:5-methylthioribose kinase
MQNLYHTDKSRTYLEIDIPKLTNYLQQKGWLSADDTIKRVQKPGEGNMNLVLRVVPDRSSSFVIKQARPWVEKFPHIKAPVERIEVEYQYYRHVNRQLSLSHYSPDILDYDRENGIMAMEDLGNAMDFSFIYRKGKQLESSYLEKAIDYLNRLKKIPAPASYPLNLELRKLNHQHIFQLPFEQNTFELDQIQPGLQQLAEKCKQDYFLIAMIQKLGQVYLGSDQYLLHGDFYPGSLLKSQDGDLKVIDPEFSFAGPEEWDIAIFTAHLFLSQMPEMQIHTQLEQYQSNADFDQHRFWAFVGIEILRRLLGLAQVPVEFSLSEKAELIDKASAWIANYDPGR